MPAIAGMLTDGIGQHRYLVERQQERSTEDASAVFAAGRVVAEGAEIIRLAERAGQGAWLGGVCHLLFLSEPTGVPSVLST
jgi:hypothetical protein